MSRLDKFFNFFHKKRENGKSKNGTDGGDGISIRSGKFDTISKNKGSIFHASTVNLSDKFDKKKNKDDKIKIVEPFNWPKENTLISQGQKTGPILNQNQDNQGKKHIYDISHTTIESPRINQSKSRNGCFFLI